MNNQIKPNSYVKVHRFMVYDLKLKGIQLLIYAIIYGFSQAQGKECSPSLKYFQQWTNSSHQGVINAVKALIDKGYIKKDKSTGKTNTYSVVSKILNPNGQ